MMKTFITRVISALAAVAVLFAVFYFFENAGIKFLSLLLVLIGTYELIHILVPQVTKLHKALFFTFVILIFLMASYYPSLATMGFSLFVVFFLIISVFTHTSFAELRDLTNYQAKSVLGFIYLGLLPSFAIRLLDLPMGTWWFLSLLGIVFAGDIGAYAVGVLVGKHKINPRLSPKKSWEGAIGGLVASAATGYGCSFLIPYVSPKAFIATALCAGFVAQFGDFFESLIKRVADVKDSGSLMPGHGGVLDRIDGVLFASPVLLIVASLFESAL